MNFVVMILGLALAAFAVIDAYVISERGEALKKPMHVAMVAAACVLVLFGCSFKLIPTGYTGVRSTFGQIDEQTVQNGFNWKIPVAQTIQLVNNKQQDTEFDDEIWSETKSRTALYYADITVTYQINAEKSAWIYANVKNYKDDLVTYDLVSSALKSTSKTLSDSDATNRAIIEPLVKQALQASLDEKYGEHTVLVNKVVIGSADFEDSYNNAIAAKQKAQLEAEQQAIENKRAVEKADADAKVKITNAKATADAALIKAEAEAKANKLLENSLTEKILKQRYIEKWNGTLPKTVAGDDGNILMQIGQ